MVTEEMDVTVDKTSAGEENWSVEQHLQLLRGEIGNEDIFQGDPLQLPPWFNQQKFERGQKFFNNNYYALFVSKLCGLISILTVPEISKILVMTHQSSEPKTAFKRYLSTIAHMLLWYGGQVNDPASWAYKSLKDVHVKHSAATHRASTEGKGTVSQASLALTQFGFMGYGLLAAEKLGINTREVEDVEGFIHFWRTIGYMVGVQDRYNICRDSVSETKAICEAILQQMFVPVMKQPFQDFTDLSVALLKGLWAIVPEVDVEAFSTYLRYVSGLPVEPCSNWYSRFMFNFQVFVHETLLSSKWFGGFWRSFLNFHMWLTLVLTMKFPLLAYYAFGVPLKPLHGMMESGLSHGSTALHKYVLATVVALLPLTWQMLVGLLAVLTSWDILVFTWTVLISSLQILSGVLSLPVLYLVWKAVFHQQDHKEKAKACYYGLVGLVIVNAATFTLSLILLVVAAFRPTGEAVKLLIRNYSIRMDQKQLLDDIQLRFHCCGGSDVTNWFYNDWQNVDIEPGHVVDTSSAGWDAVPFSCCSREAPSPCLHEGLNGFGLNSIYKTGCGPALTASLIAFLVMSSMLALLAVVPLGWLVQGMRNEQNGNDRGHNSGTRKNFHIFPQQKQHQELEKNKSQEGSKKDKKMKTPRKTTPPMPTHDASITISHKPISKNRPSLRKEQSQGPSWESMDEDSSCSFDDVQLMSETSSQDHGDCRRTLSDPAVRTMEVAPSPYGRHSTIPHLLSMLN